MLVPLPLFVALAVLFAHEHLVERLPGAESVARLAVAALVLPVPWLVARWSAKSVAATLARGRLPGRWTRLALRSQSLTVPAAFAILVAWGDLPALAVRWAGASASLELLVLLAPLIVMEVAMRLAEMRAERAIETAGLVSGAQLGPGRLRVTALVVIPLMTLAAAADAVALDRDVEVFLSHTALGMSLGLLCLGLMMCVALPLAFRWVMPVSPQLPTHLGDDLRAVASTLGFRRRALLSLQSRHRMVNAALVGPLPWPRYLVLSDGLMSFLDPSALRGVVAHEVGHAKAGHPAWLVLVFGVLPLLLFWPFQLWAAPDLDTTTWAVLALGGGLMLWLVLRGIAHRFEYEADQLSSEALGSPEHCIRALQRVGDLAPGRARERASLRHPSEQQRVRNMLRCAASEADRTAFWRRGRRLRRGILAVAVAALVTSAWSLVQLWPVDHATWLYLTGRVRDAERQLVTLSSEVLPSQRELVDELRTEVAAALELGVEDGRWDEVRGELARRAMRRTERAVREGAEPDEVGKWLGLALYEDPPAWAQSLYLYYQARAAEASPRAERLRRHTLTLEPPPPVALALSAIAPSGRDQ
ncbi:MAG: M48 family metalloprotease [Planctomycetota bacterium]